MIVDMQGDSGTMGQLLQRTDPARLADVNEDQALNPVEIDVTQLMKVKGILRAFQEEFAQGPLLTTREDHRRIRVKPPGGNHRAETVEVGVDVGGDQIHRCEGSGVRGEEFLGSFGIVASLLTSHALRHETSDQLIHIVQTFFRQERLDAINDRQHRRRINKIGRADLHGFCPDN